MDNKYIEYCKFVIQGMPKSKSNHSLTNKNGKKILPKNSPYALYEKTIVLSILEQVGEKQFSGKVVCVLNIYFKHKERHPDLNNMTKSVCDGIEKSGLIINDRDIVSVYLEEYYDYDNPRVEVEMYDYSLYKPTIKVAKRSKAEKSKIQMEKEEALAAKKKRTSKKKKGPMEVTCSLCGKITDFDHSKLIINNSKNKEYICFKCILTGVN